MVFEYKTRHGRMERVFFMVDFKCVIKVQAAEREGCDSFKSPNDQQ